MKIDRLMGIVVYLLNNGRASARRLAEEFEVSPRTIMRDIEALDRAGIPVRSCSGVDGGYQLMDGYVLDRQLATGQEYGWIVAALKGLASGYASKSLERTLAKLERFAGGEVNAVSVDISVAAEDAGINAQLSLLESAIARKCAVRFRYTNGRAETRELQVEPVSLQYRWYNWYLIAYYEKYQDYCMFKLVRMERLEATDIKNSREHDPAAIKLRDGNDDAVHVRLAGKAPAKARCREYLNGQVTREFANGDFEFCFSAPAHETFWFGALLSMGNMVSIIEPAEVRDRVVAVCRQILAEYGENTEGGAKQNEGDHEIRDQ